MRFQIAAAAIFAGLAVAAPQAADTTSSASASVTPAAGVHTYTSYSTEEITITDCAATVTDCPARVHTTSYPVVTTIPAAPVGAAQPTGAAYPSGAAMPSGTGNAVCPGCAQGSVAYNMPSPSATGGSGYGGPSFTGAGNTVVAGGALAGLGAVAALLL